MDNAKAAFARAAQGMATTLASIEHTINDLEAVYNARLYGPGGANAFTDEELLTLETAGGRAMTTDQLYAFIILCSQFQRFFRNEPAAQADYLATINQIRTDV